jgi:phosphatidylethanolamine N-methyltransferase
VEYNTWLLFRQVVDIILLNDFLSYVLFAICNLDFLFPLFSEGQPAGSTHNYGMLFLRISGGIALLLFNLWVKTSAHDVVKDYGWYWGDCFFSRGYLRQPTATDATPSSENKELHFDLVFDGIFEMAPHPMYSVGYAGYYGVSLLAASYPVLFVSLAAHAGQFAFLNFFENPHIERRYGVRKLLAERTPVILHPAPSRISRNASGINGTPATVGTRHSHGEEGDALKMVMNQSRPRSESMGTTSEETTAIDSEEGVGDDPLELNLGIFNSGTTISRSDSDAAIMATVTPPSEAKEIAREAVTQHDLLNKFFRKDVVVLSGLDLLR